jgi:hypothetical protein
MLRSLTLQIEASGSTCILSIAPIATFGNQYGLDLGNELTVCEVSHSSSLFRSDSTHLLLVCVKHCFLCCRVCVCVGGGGAQ